jgi:integrase
MLTVKKIDTLKPQAKTYLVIDEKCLYLAVYPTGTKAWRFRYQIDGRRNQIALGEYPDLKLADARDKAREFRLMVRDGQDPAEVRKAATPRGETFEEVAREWHSNNVGRWTPGYAEDILHRLKLYIFPDLGSRPIKAISAPELLSVLRKLEAQNLLETAKRQKQVCGQVFRYGIATGRCERDPSADLRGALASRKAKPYGSVRDPAGAGQLMRAVDAYEGSFVVQCALRFLPLVFVRPGELRHAEWPEINWEGEEWRIPPGKMKMKEQHLVPLSRQALEILKTIYPVTGQGRYIFPSARSKDRPLSDMALLAALRGMGYGPDDMVPHGFRSMASTLLNELGFNRDWIERQLAHSERDRVRAAYNYADYLPERRKMMQAYADYLDGLKADQGKVVPLRRAS